MKHLSLSLVSLLVMVACGGAQEVTTPPPPLRPEAEPVVAEKPQSKDCEPVDPDDELKALPFDERSIPEGMKLAEQGRAELKTAESAEVDRPTREAYVTDAVQNLITALRADPYNVPATYHLAAAYARINRRQCSINLLTRLLQMRPHPSKNGEVEMALNKLLGRGTTLDADFSDMRSDDRFRALIQKMCDGTNDPNCVYGARGGK